MVALDRILHSGQLAHDILRAAVASLARCRGCASARAAVAVADGRSESPPETRTRLILLSAGFAPVPQYEIRVGGSFVARVDLAFVAERWRSSTRVPGTGSPVSYVATGGGWTV